ncbi:MAG: DMT family transporter [Betaproteobacteria bacterium]|nr:DMT family transporter [Betaproteobacteria bacterium]
MPAQSNLLKGLGWITVSILCWVPLFPVAKRVLPVVDAFAMGTVRYAIGIVLLLALLALLEGRQALSYEGRFWQAALYGFVGITGFNAFVWYGLTFTRPEHAAILMATQTPLVALVLWVTRGLRPAGFTLACIVAAFAGVLLVVSKGDPASVFAGGVEGASLAGDLLVFLGALSWIAYTLAAARFPRWSPLRWTALTCVPGTFGLLLVNALAVRGGIAEVPSAAALGSIAWQIAYFAVGTVVLGVLGFNFSVKYLGPLNTMLTLNLVPVGVFAIEAALGRSFAAIEIGGAALVIGALAANNLYLRGSSRSR